MDLEGIVLREISQTEKVRCQMISLAFETSDHFLHRISFVEIRRMNNSILSIISLLHDLALSILLFMRLEPSVPHLINSCSFITWLE